MLPLVDLQERFARALVSGDGTVLDGHLVGGNEPNARLAIHLRHYAASLTASLCDKFPACAWLAGPDTVRAAARDYVRARPPGKPCIAEYGADFPEFLAAHGRAARLPYLKSFARLEWCAGQASIAIDAPPLSWSAIARQGPDRLVDSALSLQTGLHYVRSDWRIDELFEVFMGGRTPEHFELRHSAAFVEVRGTRGALRLERLDAAAFAFRAALAARRSIGAAAGAALDCDGAFDAGAALRALVAAGLVTGLATAVEEPGS